jgi:hypothetical protein
MPHGISFDLDGNIWLTDVALHQIFMYERGKWQTPRLVLGTRFVPGNGATTFCKPTDVKVSSRGVVFISDGYCNSRIVVYHSNGTFVKVFGDTDGMVVLHSLALFEQFDLICVADRENNRIVCYNAGIAAPDQIGRKQFDVYPGLGAVYAIEVLGE